MSVVRLEKVVRRYGATHIFGPVDLAIELKDRIGLIGLNGAGKSSLVHILAGDRPDEGKVEYARGVRIGHLKQQFDIDSETTLYDFAALGFDHLKDVSDQLKRLEAKMADADVQNDPDALSSTLVQYERATEIYASDGGFEQASRTKGALIGLGFTEAEFERPLATFSGGERARAQLARVLLARPNLLLLDEPTNHLDLESTIWLQETLLKYDKAIVLISHDSYLLSAVAQNIWDVDLGDVVAYNNGYEASRSIRAERRERMRKTYAADVAERERLEAYVRKYKAGNRSAQAKSRQRRLDRMGEATPPPSETHKTKITLPAAPRSERAVCTIADVALGYDDELVIVDFNAEIIRGDRIGIAGPNGTGKTTLLKSIAGTLTPMAGSVHVGRGVISHYFSQDRIDLPAGMTVIEALTDASHMPDNEARNILARFLFRGEDVFKTTDMLSGGEKSRLALARLLLTPGNLFLLDEPTNHLDMETREAVLDVFRDYGGTLMFITHDRALLEAWADIVWWVEDGEVARIDGGYKGLSTWLESRQQK